MNVRSHSRSRGATLGTILLLTVVITILALALVSSSVTHLHLSNRYSNGEIARNLAESAISAGLEEVLQDEQFGTQGTSPEVVELQGVEAGALGRLAFHQPTAESWSMLYSTNNLDSEAAQAGAGGRVVPGNSLHLVGVGESNGVRRTLEAIFHVPRFPYVVASSGRFETQGETLIAGIDRIDSLNGVLLSKDEDLRPGDVVANSSDSNALALGGETTVTGDATAVGGVHLESGAEVRGKVRAHSSPESIPHYAVQDFDPELTGKLGVQHLNQAVVNNAHYEGWVRREGDLSISQGLHLDNGVLYVNGNLIVSGGVTGTGALFVNGSALISGKSSLASDNVAAIVSEGDVTLQGPRGQNSVFRGLVYSNGALLAENMTLVGTVMLGGGDEKDLMLKDSRVIYSPDSVKVDLEHGPRTALTFVAPSGAKPGTYLGTKGTNQSLHSKIRIYVSSNSQGEFVIYPEGVSEDEGATASTVDEAMALIKSLVAGDDDQSKMQAFESTTNPKLIDLLDGLHTGTVAHEEGAVELLTLDPSNFLSLSERIRLILIREV